MQFRLKMLSIVLTNSEYFFSLKDEVGRWLPEIISLKEESGVQSSATLSLLQCGADKRAPHVLIVDDNEELRRDLIASLSHYKMSVVSAADFPAAVQKINEAEIDIIILDQWLGRIDAVTLLPEFRRLTAAPIVMLTANQSEADRIVALELGAADFLLKPVSGREIVARIRAHLRREQPRQRQQPPQASRAWRVEPVERRVYAPSGQQIRLTSTEFELLNVLMESPGQSIDRDALSMRVLNRNYRPEDRALDNLVHNIRQKIVMPSARAPIIASIRNRGYSFTGFPEPEEGES